jgi:hypothetical protein
MEDLTQRLCQAGYICDEWFGTAVAASLGTKPVAGAFLFGPIGTGKTYLPEVLARVLDAEQFFYQCFPGTREEDLMVKMLPSEKTVSGIALYDGVMTQAIQATQGGDFTRKVILVLDEWDKTRPSADSFLLDFLQTGRINFSGRLYSADLSRLIVFLTFNVERELSEPLLRRLPKIDFQHLSPSLVYRALLLTHRGHPYLYSTVVLYERCLMADLPKPATIQELRQLLDAITTLGDRADWDSLVFQFVTKSEENHERLRRIEHEKSRWQQKYRRRLDAAAYDAMRSFILKETSAAAGLTMPRLAEARGFDDLIETAAEAPDLSQCGGVLELTKTAYNELVRLVDQPADTPDCLGDLAEVTSNYISLTRPLPLSRVNELDGLWGENGEVLLIEPMAAWKDVKALPSWAHINIVKFSKKEILAKIDGIDLRWTPEAGAEIIVDLAKHHVFQHVFGESWGRSGEGKWIGRKGLIYQRYQQLTEQAGRLDNGPVYSLVEAEAWGPNEHDWLADTEVPLLAEFLKEHYEFSRQDGWKRFLFPGIEIAFRDNGIKKNDALRVMITGKFPGRLVKYLRAWLPQGELPFCLTVKTNKTERELHKSHGFALSANNTGVSTRRAEGFKLNYNSQDSTVTIRKTLDREQITKPKIDAALKRLAAFTEELTC